MSGKLACSFAILAIVLSLPAAADLYVANSGATSVTIYPPSAVGNAIPSRTIAGATTALVTPFNVTVDAVNNELYVADFFGQAIRVYALAASGNVASIRTLIDGVNSNLQQPRQVIVDTANNEIAVVSFNDAIRVYPRTANGDIAPVRVISGANTLLSNALSLAFDAVHGEYVTATSNAGANNAGILVFPRTANGNVAPSRVISGGATLLGLNNSPYVAYDAVNAEYVAHLNQTPSAIVVFPRLASGNVAPSRAIQGPSTALNGLGGVVFDPVTTRYFATNYVSGNYITAYPRTASGDVAPVLTITGGFTGLNNAFGLAVDATGGPSGVGGAVTPVPTLNGAGLLVLLGLLAAASLAVMRRYKRS